MTDDQFTPRGDQTALEAHNLMAERIYICGPITLGDLANNIRQATQAFLRLARAGCAPMCPHWSAYAGGPLVAPTSGQVYAIAERLPAGTTHADWMGIDLPWVRVSDAVLRLPGESAGADAEVAEANRLGIPVFWSVDEVIGWAASRREADAVVVS